VTKSLLTSATQAGEAIDKTIKADPKSDVVKNLTSNNADTNLTAFKSLLSTSGLDTKISSDVASIANASKLFSQALTNAQTTGNPINISITADGQLKIGDTTVLTFQNDTELTQNEGAQVVSGACQTGTGAQAKSTYSVAIGHQFQPTLTVANSKLAAHGSEDRPAGARRRHRVHRGDGLCHRRVVLRGLPQQPGHRQRERSAVWLRRV